jgi:RNA polymerase sigma-70 factor (ECF subfamily)
MSDADPPAADVERPISPDVVTTLVQSHRDFLRFLERKVGDRALAEDILQDAFVRGIDRIDSLRSEDSVTAWFYRMLRNAAVDHFRRRGATDRAMAALAAELSEDIPPEVETQRAVCRCVLDLAGTLKPEYSAALQRVEVDGLSVQAFAEEASITANNAAVRLFRAREALRKRVAASCGTCADHGCLNCTCGTGGENKHCL